MPIQQTIPTPRGHALAAVPATRVRRRVCQRGAGASVAGTGISRGLRVAALLAGWAVGAIAPAFAAADCTPSAQSVPFAPQLHALGAGRWWVAADRGEATPANGGVVAQALLLRAGPRWWLVGSGPTPAWGEALACAARAATGAEAEVGDLIDTRAQPELVLGNAAFPAARVWALADVARAMATRCRDCVARLSERIGAAAASLDADAIRLPTHRLGRHGASQGRLGPFHWWALPRARGERTLVLRADDPALLIAQGLVWVGGVPNLRDTDSAVLLASLRRLRGLADGAVVLGEQGGPGSVADIDRHIAYLLALRAAVRAAVERGSDQVAALAAITLPDFADLAGHAEVHALNRQRVWRELEAEAFR